MSPYIAEFIGTAILVFLGDSVVANNALDKTKGHGADLIVIASAGPVPCLSPH